MKKNRFNFKLLIIYLIPISLYAEITSHLHVEMPWTSPTPWLEDRLQMLSYLPKNGKVAEIGVQEGIFSESIIKYTNPTKLVLVDCWEEQDYDLYPDTANVEQNKQELLYQSVLKKFENNPAITVVRKYSADAAKLFEDEYFDWIYIDANHEYHYVKQDLEAWYPKVKKGGFICGHDYVVPFGVIKAVNEFITKNNLSLNMLTTKDMFLSWVVYKK